MGCLLPEGPVSLVCFQYEEKTSTQSLEGLCDFIHGVTTKTSCGQRQGGVAMRTEKHGLPPLLTRQQCGKAHSATQRPPRHLSPGGNGSDSKATDTHTNTTTQRLRMGAEQQTKVLTKKKMICFLNICPRMGGSIHLSPPTCSSREIP